VCKYKALCRTCYKNRPEYGPTPRKKPTTCEACKIPGQHHRNSDWLWNMLVTRKPRKGKKHKILWFEETLRDQLWWLKPQKKVKAEVKAEPGVVMSSSASSSSSGSTSSSSSGSASSSLSNSDFSAAVLRPQMEIIVKIEPGTGGEIGERQ
jgi:hypothetical protein